MIRLLNGKRALVTGATSGIGFHTAEALAGLGALVYVTGRDENRGEEAVGQLRAAAGHQGVHFIRADSSTVGGNQQLAEELLSEMDRLDILVNNVGGTHNDRWETDDDYEASLAMNFIGPFALTEALLPALRRSVPARIVNVASAAYTMWKGDPFVDLQSRQAYLGSAAYSRSKLLNVLWTFALARRLEGSGVVANAADPGTAWTSMTVGTEARSFPLWGRVLWPALRLYQRRGTPQKAARSSIFLASAPEAETMSGQYIEPNGRPGKPSPALLDRESQEKTWALAEALVLQAPTAILRKAGSRGIAVG